MASLKSREPYIYLSEKEVSKEEKRKGKCKVCGKCCRIVLSSAHNIEEWIEYIKGFGDIKVLGGKVCAIIHKKCKHLGKDNKCKRHENKPLPCQHFPTHDDPVWLYVKDTCGYSFKIEDRFMMSK